MVGEPNIVEFWPRAEKAHIKEPKSTFCRHNMAKQTQRFLVKKVPDSI